MWLKLGAWGNWSVKTQTTDKRVIFKFIGSLSN